jgi:hypothetical protein
MLGPRFLFRHAESRSRGKPVIKPADVVQEPFDCAKDPCFLSNSNSGVDLSRRPQDRHVTQARN